MRNKIFSISASVLLVFCLFSTASAKNIERGTVELDGGLSLAVSSGEHGYDDDPKTERDTTEVSATMFYYLAQNIGVGVYWEHEDVSYKYNSLTHEETGNSVGPAISLNFSLNDKASLQLQAAYTMSSQEIKETGDPSLELSGNMWIGAGKLNYFLTDDVALNFILAYYSLEMEDENFNGRYNVKYESSGYQTGIGLSVFIK